MKKRIFIAVLTASALTLSLAACGNNKAAASTVASSQSAASSQAAATVDPATVDLEAVCRANTFEALAQRHQSITATSEYTNPDGSSGGSYSTSFAANDGTPFSYYEEETDSGLYISVYYDGWRYQYLESGDITSVTPLDNYMLDGQLSFVVAYDDEETVVSCEAQGDQLILTTRLTGDGGYLSDFYDATITSHEYEYVVDAETLELQSMSHYALDEVGKRSLYMTTVNAFDKEAAKELPGFVTDYTAALVDGQPSRTITFHDVDTGDEVSYQVLASCATDCIFYLNRPDCALYADEACTQTLPENTPNADGTWSDLTAYVKAVA